MGACGSCEEEVPGEVVDLKRGPKSRELWRARVHLGLGEEILFFDGKALADYVVFLVELERYDLVAALWQLSLARFGLYWSAEELAACKRTARSLEASWATYLAAPTGFGNFMDVEEWHALDPRDAQQRAFTTEAAPLVPRLATGRLVDKDSLLYEFAVAAMFGVHVSVVCQTVMEDKYKQAFERTSRDLSDVWDETFPDMSLLGCLQNACYTYMVPPEGTAYSPPTSELTDGVFDVPFMVQDYCPQLFAQVRHLSGITNEQYYDAICRPDVEFVQISTNSKSGELFFFSQDGKFFIKTLSNRNEAESLMRMLPDFIARFQVAPQSMLCRFLGLYRVFGDDFEYDQNFLVMQSVTLHDLPVHHRYDLKGSRKHRDARPTDSVGKDINFLNDFGCVDVCPTVAEQLVRTHAEDVKVLRKHSIMDYSILLNVHDRKRPVEGHETAAEVAHRLRRSFSDSLDDGSIHVVRLGNHSLREGSSRWAHHVSGTTASQGMDLQIEASSSSSAVPGWRPGAGIPSQDGRYVYTMTLIDILTPFYWYPKAQVVLQEVGSCGHGDAYSRVPPAVYAARQRRMVERMCRWELPAGEDSESAGEEATP